MRLRLLVLRHILLVAALFSAVIFFFVRYSINQKYSQIELGEQHDRVEILDRMLAANLLVFGNWNLGYAKWDDTLEFAEGEQPYFFQANFSENELGSMDGAGNSYDVTPDHVFVFNGDHLVGYAGYDYDEERRITTPGKALMEAASDILAIQKSKLGTDAITGFVRLKHMSFEYALSTVTDSDGNADTQAYFLSLRRMGPEVIADLKHATTYELSWGEPGITSDVTHFDGDSIITDHPVLGIGGEPAFTVSLKAPRTGVMIGRNSMNIFLGSIFALIFLSICATMLVFEKLVVRRISNLYGIVRQAPSDPKVLDGIKPSYRDEITDLSFQVRRMFEAIYRSKSHDEVAEARKSFDRSKAS